MAAAECGEAEGRFLDDIASGVWAICEESSWVVPAHNYERLGEFRESLPDFRRRRIDLFAAETGALLALVQWLLGERLAGSLPVVPIRIEHEVCRRILDPYPEQDDFRWMWLRPAPTHHVNNWTPWCTSACLLALALLENDPARLQRAVGKAPASLNVFLGSYADDGGCDEGTSPRGRIASGVPRHPGRSDWRSDRCVGRAAARRHRSIPPPHARLRSLVRQLR